MTLRATPLVFSCATRGAFSFVGLQFSYLSFIPQRKPQLEEKRRSLLNLFNLFYQENYHSARPGASKKVFAKKKSNDFQTRTSRKRPFANLATLSLGSQEALAKREETEKQNEAASLSKATGPERFGERQNKEICRNNRQYIVSLSVSSDILWCEVVLMVGFCAVPKKTSENKNHRNFQKKPSPNP